MEMLLEYYENGEIKPEGFKLIEIEFHDPLIYADDPDEAWRNDLLKWSKDMLITEVI